MMRGRAAPSGGAKPSVGPSGPPPGEPPPPPRMAGRMTGGDVLEAAPEPELAKAGRVMREMKQSGDGHAQMLADQYLRGNYRLRFENDPRFNAMAREAFPDASPAEIGEVQGYQSGRNAILRDSIADPAPKAVHEGTHIWQDVKGLRGTPKALEAQAYTMENNFNAATGRPTMSAGRCNALAEASASYHRR
jgi:hypothetical protein